MSLINNFSKQHFGLSLVLYIREQSTFKNLVRIICAGEPSYRNYIAALKCFLQWVKKLNNNDKNNNNQKTTTKNQAISFEIHGWFYIKFRKLVSQVTICWIQHSLSVQITANCHSYSDTSQFCTTSTVAAASLLLLFSSVTTQHHSCQLIQCTEETSCVSCICNQWGILTQYL